MKAWKRTQDITLCLSEPEHRALHYALRDFGKQANIAHVAQWLVLCALLHPKEMDRLSGPIINYAKAEGLDQVEHMRSLLARRKAGRLGQLALTR